jgi:hypothetical protein
MPLFLVEHRHTAQTCPTQNPDMVRQLRSHVSKENTDRMGVNILGDWVSEPDHHVVFIVEAAGQEQVENLAAPFRMAGDVSIQMGLTCEDTARACLGEA